MIPIDFGEAELGSKLTVKAGGGYIIYCLRQIFVPRLKSLFVIQCRKNFQKQLKSLFVYIKHLSYQELTIQLVICNYCFSFR